MYKPNRTARLISAIYRHQLAYLNRKLTACNLGGGSYVFLLHIYANPGITQTELSTRLMFDRATVSKMLAALEKRGMLRRSPNPDDGRAILLEITPKGIDVTKDLLEAMTDYRALMLNGVSPEEEVFAAAFLKKILGNIQHGLLEEKNKPPRTP